MCLARGAKKTRSCTGYGNVVYWKCSANNSVAFVLMVGEWSAVNDKQPADHRHGSLRMPRTKTLNIYLYFSATIETQHLPGESHQVIVALLSLFLSNWISYVIFRELNFPCKMLISSGHKSKQCVEMKNRRDESFYWNIRRKVSREFISTLSLTWTYRLAHL